ncbi:hypothetical protein pipiens_015048 [Culex pipiens pipiens]|uniref:Uncharacterized protein n=1 Tax=Culex pipiens pipiens TaxID=38569 RepID=A0ABD1CS55_CULPP
MVSVFRLSRWIIDCGKICILSPFVELDLCEQLPWNQKFQGNHMILHRQGSKTGCEEGAGHERKKEKQPICPTSRKWRAGNADQSRV